MASMRRTMRIVILLGSWLIVSSGIAADEPAVDSPQDPQLAPLPSVVPEPANNPTTPEKIALGRQLFFDPRLSGGNTTSCATCHPPERAFADGLPRAKGAGGKMLGRNTPTVLNAGFLERLFWDGRAASLEEQALGPITSPDEMAQDLDRLEQELRGIPGYVAGFERAFGGRVDRQNVAFALAAFQRSLIAGDAPLDRYLRGDGQALSDEAKRGMELFVGEADCIRCHHGAMLSDGKFHRLGISFTDKGLGLVTKRAEDNYKFRTPPLRNVARTSPYMHDGSRETLFDVVTFYFREVPAKGRDGLPLDVESQLGLSFSDIEAVVAFLESLTGEPPHVTPPQLP